MKPLLNPRGWGIRSPHPVFILRRKRSSWRHSGPGTEGLGALWGAGGPPLLSPHAPQVATAKRHGAVQPHCNKTCTLSSTLPVLESTPKPAAFEGVATLAGRHGVPWVKPSFPGAKAGLFLPKADFFPMGDGSSEQHASTAPPPAPAPGCGWLWRLSGRKSQIKEGGTSRDPSPCETAVASKAAHISWGRAPLPCRCETGPGWHGAGSPSKHVSQNSQCVDASFSHPSPLQTPQCSSEPQAGFLTSQHPCPRAVLLRGAMAQTGPELFGPGQMRLLLHEHTRQLKPRVLPGSPQAQALGLFK